MLSVLIHFILQIKGLIIFRRRVGVLGNFHVLNPKNVKIGFNCGINYGVFILGHHNIEIGNNVVLSAGVMIIDAGLDMEKFGQLLNPPHVSDKIVIEDGVWVGAGAIILPGVTIGKKSVVGAGSVVTRNIPAFSIAVGNPARVIGTINE